MPAAICGVNNTIRTATASTHASMQVCGYRNEPLLTTRPTTRRSCLVAGARPCRPAAAASASPAAALRSSLLPPSIRRQAPCSQQRQLLVARAEAEPERKVVYNKEFGYSRKDVLIIIVGLLGAGILLYEGLKATGMDAGMAGNWVQLIIFMGICVGWVSTYIWRVATKNMTYARQLQMYEEAVIEKRLEEMTEAELEQLMSEVEAEKKQGVGRLLMRKAEERQQQQQQQQQ